MTDDERRERLAKEINRLDGLRKVHLKQGATYFADKFALRIDALEWVRDNLDLGEQK